MVEKATLYDMDLDSSKKHVAVACQDRNIRLEIKRNSESNLAEDWLVLVDVFVCDQSV